MDETGVPFDNPTSTTIDFKGKKRVAVNTTNNSNGCTVFLACAMDGSKLKPLIVFKGKPGGNIDKQMKKDGDNGFDSRVVSIV